MRVLCQCKRPSCAPMCPCEVASREKKVAVFMALLSEKSRIVAVRRTLKRFRVNKQPGRLSFSALRVKHGREDRSRGRSGARDTMAISPFDRILRGQYSGRNVALESQESRKIDKKSTDSII